MNKTALFCDGTEGYVYPPEPKESELVTFRFRTAKDDVDRVGLVTSADTYVMEKECTQGEFDYYTFETRLGEEPFRYCFEVQSGTEKYYYGRCGISREILEYYNFVVVPGFSTPDWAKGAVMYQIFTDRFYNGDKSNDVETNEYYYIGDYSQRVTNWDKYPANMGVREFYGGDLQGVMDKLDYLQDLGVEVVYFNPLFVSPSNHKYDIQDYDYIDPHYGKIVDDGGEVLPNGVTDNSQATKYKKRTTGLKNLEASNELFIKLVEELHRRGMKVILDGVFNHCGSFNKWMDRERIYEGEEDYEPGAYVSADSPYRSYFRFFKEGPENWPYNGNYDGWWGHDTLPKLNYEDSVKLENYILYIGRKWVSPPYNVDGWRLDVADELPDEFLENLRAAAKAEKPGAVVLGEVWEDASNKEAYGQRRKYFQGHQLDSVMNYPFRNAILGFLTGADASNMMEIIMNIVENYPPQVLRMLMNHIGTHDTERAITVLAGEPMHNHGRHWQSTTHLTRERRRKGLRLLRLAALMQYTLPGIPCIYYGDEAGLEGYRDPFNRGCYPWGKEDEELIEWYRHLAKLRNACPCLKEGALYPLMAGDHCMAYVRDDGKERLLVAINAGAQDHCIYLPPEWQEADPMIGKLPDDRNALSLAPLECTVLKWAYPTEKETPAQPAPGPKDLQ